MKAAGRALMRTAGILGAVVGSVPCAGHHGYAARGSVPNGVAVNPVTNTAYVVNSGSASVTVVNGANRATATVSTGSGPVAVAVNPATNTIYVANSLGNSVTVINGATNAATTRFRSGPFGSVQPSIQ